MLTVHTILGNYILFSILFVTNINPAEFQKHHNEIGLKNLLLGKEYKPIILVLNDKPQQASSDFDELTSADEGLEDDDYGDKRIVNNYAGYLLDRLLRTDNAEELNSSTENTKQMLRSALIARCKKVEKCIKICSAKRPSCKKSCQDRFDEMNFCAPPPKPKKCKKLRCGKTMPPSWKF